MAIAKAPARVHASDVLCLFTLYVYSRAPALLPPISPSPYHLYFIASFLARARASAHERRACARANTRNNAVDKHRARAKLLRARARARLCERSRAQACPYLLSPPLFGAFTASPCHCRVLRAEASRNHHSSIQRMDLQEIEPWASRMLSVCDTTTPQALVHNTHTQTEYTRPNVWSNSGVSWPWRRARRRWAFGWAQ